MGACKKRQQPIASVIVNGIGIGSKSELIKGGEENMDISDVVRGGKNHMFLSSASSDKKDKYATDENMLHYHFLCRTSAFRLRRALAPIAWNALFGANFQSVLFVR